jgi:hypothetical protein
LSGSLDVFAWYGPYAAQDVNKVANAILAKIRYARSGPRNGSKASGRSFFVTADEIGFAMVIRMLAFMRFGGRFELLQNLN